MNPAAAAREAANDIAENLFTSNAPGRPKVDRLVLDIGGRVGVVEAWEEGPLRIWIEHRILTAIESATAELREERDRLDAFSTKLIAENDTFATISGLVYDIAEHLNEHGEPIGSGKWRSNAIKGMILELIAANKARAALQPQEPRNDADL